MEHTGSLSCVDLPNIAHFIKIPKTTRVNITTNLMRKTYGIKLTVVLINFFQNSHFHLKP